MIKGLQTLDFDFFLKHQVYLYGLKEDLCIAIELNLITGDNNAKYKISDMILEYDSIFDDPYATSIRETYIR